MKAYTEEKRRHAGMVLGTERGRLDLMNGRVFDPEQIKPCGEPDPIFTAAFREGYAQVVNGQTQTLDI